MSGKRWILVTFLGWLLGFVLVLCFSVLFDAIGLEGYQFILGAGMGAGVGFMQWRFLRRKGQIDQRWIWYGILGLTLPFLVFDLLDEFGMYSPTGNQIIRICTAVGGLLAGLLQYWLFRPGIHRTWILGSLLGWGLAGQLVLAMDYTSRLSANNWVLFFLNIFCILGGGLILGWTTGWFLRRMT